MTMNSSFSYKIDGLCCGMHFPTRMIFIFLTLQCVCVIRICEKLCLKWQKKKEKKKDNPLEDFSVSVD